MKNDRQAHLAIAAKLPDKTYGPRVPRKRDGIPTLLIIAHLTWFLVAIAGLHWALS